MLWMRLTRPNMTEPLPSWCQKIDHDLRLALYVQPGARKTEVCGEHHNALKIRLAAPPVDGKANDTLCRFLADTFSVPLRNIEIIRGEQARQKTIIVRTPKQLPEWLA